MGMALFCFTGHWSNLVLTDCSPGNLDSHSLFLHLYIPLYFKRYKNESRILFEHIFLVGNLRIWKTGNVGKDARRTSLRIVLEILGNLLTWDRYLSNKHEGVFEGTLKNWQFFSTQGLPPPSSLLPLRLYSPLRRSHQIFAFVLQTFRTPVQYCILAKFH